jgi:hypothetical protein
MVVRLIAIIVTMLMLAGCQPQLDNQRSIREWIGYHADELVRVWGAPMSSYQFQNGDKLLQYTESDINAASNFGVGSIGCDRFGRCFGGELYDPLIINQYRCTTRFILSPSLIITNVTQEGSCRWFPKKLSPVAKIAVTLPPINATTKKPYCREYRSTVIIDGKPQNAFGKKCLQPDGTWAGVQ